MRAFIADRLWQKKATWKAVTNAAGRFELSGLPEDGTFYVSARLEGWKIESEGGSPVYKAKVGQELHFVAKPLLLLSVSVLLPDDTQPPYADIRFEEGESSSLHRWTPSDPQIEIKPGSYEVFANATIEDTFYRSEKVPLSVEEGQTPPAVTLRLKAWGAIKGKVMFPQDQVPESVFIILCKVSKPEPPPLTRLNVTSHRQWPSPAKGDNSYRFAYLSPGLYYLAAMLSFRGPVCAEAFVEVLDRTVHQDLEVPPVDPSQCIILYVYGPDGKLLRDIRVQLLLKSKSFTQNAYPSKMRRKDGSYLLIVPKNIAEEDPVFKSFLSHSFMESSEKGQIRFFLSVHSPKYGEKEVEFDPERDKEVVVTFGEPATLIVTFEGYEEKNYPGVVSVTLEKQEDPMGSPWLSVSRASGENKVKLGPVEPGSYELVATLSAGPLSRELFRMPVTLQPGDNSLSLTLPELYELIVHVANPGKNWALILTTEERKRGFVPLLDRKRIDEEGNVIFKDLPPGRYVVKLEAPGKGGEMIVSVSEQTEVVFVPKEFNAYRIYVWKKDGYLAKAGFQDGDLIIGIGDKQFEDFKSLTTAMAAAALLEKVDFIVLRNGRTITIQADPKDFQDPHGMGGSLEPAAR